jgi:hypothetical protein
MSNEQGLDARLDNLYEIFPRPEDPYKPEGRERYESALKYIRELLGHKFFEDILEKKEVSVLDVCGGTGIGGVALKGTVRKGCKGSVNSPRPARSGVTYS